MKKARFLLHEEDEVLSKKSSEADYGQLAFQKEETYGSMVKKETVQAVLDSTMRHRQIRDKIRKEV